MRHVEPYRTERGLLNALDNGGRFYNVFAHAGDEQIARAELAKAAGATGSAANAVLFFEMAQVGLPDAARARAVRALGPRARRDYRDHKPTAMVPSRVDPDGTTQQPVIVEGVVRVLRDRSQFTGTMMLPISTGQTTTFMMVPLYDQFDVYELFDDRRMRRPCCVVATPRGLELPDGERVRFGGTIETLDAHEGAERRHAFFVEAEYYTRLG